jgi:hypothetical protein
LNQAKKLLAYINIGEANREMARAIKIQPNKEKNTKKKNRTTGTNC